MGQVEAEDTWSMRSPGPSLNVGFLRFEIQIVFWYGKERIGMFLRKK